MRLRQVPIGDRRRLVDVETEPDAVLRLGGDRREVEVGGRVVSGVAAEDDERLHLAALEIGCQHREIGDARAGVAGRARVHDGLAGVPERGIQGRDGRVHLEGLLRAGEDQRSSRRSPSSPWRPRRPTWRRCRRRRSRRPTRRRRAPELGRERQHERRDPSARQRQTVVGGNAGRGERALRDVEPVHRVRIAPAGGIAARERDRVGVVQEEIGVEREDDAGLVEVVDRVDPGAGRRAQAGLTVFVGERRPRRSRALAENASSGGRRDGPRSARSTARRRSRARRHRRRRGPRGAPSRR